MLVKLLHSTVRRLASQFGSARWGREVKRAAAIADHMDAHPGEWCYVNAWNGHIVHPDFGTLRRWDGDIYRPFSIGVYPPSRDKWMARGFAAAILDEAIMRWEKKQKAGKREHSTAVIDDRLQEGR